MLDSQFGLLFAHYDSQAAQVHMTIISLSRNNYLAATLVKQISNNLNMVNMLLVGQTD